MTYQYVELSPAVNRVARLTLRRAAKRNALCMAMRDELESALGEIATDEKVHALVLAGDAGFFCAGFDLAEGMATDGKAFIHRFKEFYEACYLFPKPVVTAVDGPALGGGFDLALMADFVIASDRASFRHPEIEFGPVSITPLARFVPPGRARELALLGDTLSATDALSMGIVHRVVAPDQVLEVAVELAEKLAARPLQALVLTKGVQTAALVPDYLRGDVAAVHAAVAASMNEA